MDFALAILESGFWFVVVLSVMIFVHELGHYLMAKLSGVKVEVFSFGFGPRLFGFRGRETDYRVSAIPLGGYVKMLGEAPEEAEAGAQAEVSPADQGRELYSKSRPVRFLVFVMGAFLNIVMAVVFTAVVYRIGVEIPAYLDELPVVGWVDKGSPAHGKGIETGDTIVKIDGDSVHTWQDVNLAFTETGAKPTAVHLSRDGSMYSVEITPLVDRDSGISYVGLEPAYPAVIKQIDPEKPAYKAGLRNDDLITAIDGKPIENIFQAIEVIHSSADKKLSITVRRGKETLTRVVQPVLDEKEGVGLIGFSREIPMKLKRMGLVPAIRESLKDNSEQAFLLFYILERIVRRDLSVKTLSGPIEIAKISRRFAKGGLVQLLRFMAFISLQIGILNLLPIPVLDGGHIFILLVEGVVRRDFSLKFKERLMHVGFILLVLLMVFVLFNDILKNIPSKDNIPW
jgi:regulator of sigma E protease